jgi:hypothetical protein
MNSPSNAGACRMQPTSCFPPLLHRPPLAAQRDPEPGLIRCTRPSRLGAASGSPQVPLVGLVDRLKGAVGR